MVLAVESTDDSEDGASQPSQAIQYDSHNTTTDSHFVKELHAAILVLRKQIKADIRAELQDFEQRACLGSRSRRPSDDVSLCSARLCLRSPIIKTVVNADIEGPCELKEAGENSVEEVSSRSISPIMVTKPPPEDKDSDSNNSTEIQESSKKEPENVSDSSSSESKTPKPPYKLRPLARRQSQRRVSVRFLKIPPEEAKTLKDRARLFATSTAFDTFSASMVILNAVTIGIQADHMARSLAEKPSLGWQIVDALFCLIFSSELSLRIFAFRTSFFVGSDWKWNVFDFLLVGMQVFDACLSLVVSGGSTLNFSFLRILRILRLIRIMRIIRILRLINDLRTIVSSIMGSLKSLMWTTILLFLFVYVFAVYFTQLVLDYRISNRDADQVHPQDDDLSYYFGSLGRSIFSLYQSISGGVDWDDIADPLMGRISVLLGFVMSAYTAFCFLALMNVVTGVFVEAALEAAKEDRASYMLRHVRELFARADPQDTGHLDWERFEAYLDEDFMVEFFKVIDVDRADAKSVFALLDADDSGKIDLEEFLNGCLGLHGPAKALHLASLMYETRLTARFHFMQMVNMHNDIKDIMQTIPALANRERRPEASLDDMSERRSFQAPLQEKERLSVTRRATNGQVSSQHRSSTCLSMDEMAMRKSFSGRGFSQISQNEEDMPMVRTSTQNGRSGNRLSTDSCHARRGERSGTNSSQTEWHSIVPGIPATF